MPIVVHRKQLPEEEQVCEDDYEIGEHEQHDQGFGAALDAHVFLVSEPQVIVGHVCHVQAHLDDFKLNELLFVLVVAVLVKESGSAEGNGAGEADHEEENVEYL